MRFPRARRITQRRDFQRVRRKGRSYRGRHMILGVMADESIRTLRVGIITTRRLGNAVTRVGVRRRIRGVLQRQGAGVLPGHWIVIVAFTSAADVTSAELERDWLKLARRAQLIDSPDVASTEGAA